MSLTTTGQVTLGQTAADRPYGKPEQVPRRKQMPDNDTDQSAPHGVEPHIRHLRIRFYVLYAKTPAVVSGTKGPDSGTHRVVGAVSGLGIIKSDSGTRAEIAGQVAANVLVCPDSSHQQYVA